MMYDVFCTTSYNHASFGYGWLLAHREELEVSNIRLNFFCWYLRKFPERHSNLRKQKIRRDRECHVVTAPLSHWQV